MRHPLAAPKTLIVATCRPDIKNQFVGMTYDAAGNLINDGAGHAFTYDPENRLLTAGAWSYVYDGDGNRVKKYSGSTGTLYWRGPDGEAINESDLTQSTWKRFVFFNGQRIARRDSATGNVYYFFSDHLGSIGVVTDSLGSTIENESDYYPYGGERVIANSLTDEWYKFTGKERDSESGLDNFEARYFGSSMGRFMSPDPDQDSGSDNMGDPQMWNGYAYVDNNPLSRNDPSGRTVSICDTNGQYCQAVSDEDYAKAQQADQYNHAGSLDQLKEKEGGLSNITDSNGNVVGTVMYTRDENAPAEGVNPEGEKLLAGYAAGGVIGRAFGAAWGTVAGWFGRAGGTAAGEATGQTTGQLGVRAGGVIERVFQTSAGPIQVYAKVEAEGTTAVIKEVAVYPAESNTAVSAGFTQTRQGLKAILNELKESGFTDFRMEPQYRVGGVNAGGYTGTLKGKL